MRARTLGNWRPFISGIGEDCLGNGSRWNNLYWRDSVKCLAEKARQRYSRTMGNSLKGIHRESRPRPMEDAAWITDGNISMYLGESRYKTSGYEPAWDALEWADLRAPKRPHVTKTDR